MSYIDLHAGVIRARHTLVCHPYIWSLGQGNIYTLITTEKVHFYLALLVMITFVQINASSYRACKKLNSENTINDKENCF